MDVTGTATEEDLTGISECRNAAEVESHTDRRIEQDCDQAIATSSTSPSSPPGNHRFQLSSDAAQDEESELSSPPSSPPEALAPPIPNTHKPAFSFLKRKRSTNDCNSAPLPLSERNANVQKSPQLRTSKRALTQMQIDLGGDTRKLCKICGMEYIPSVKEDSTLHKDFCSMNVAGVELGKLFLKDETLRHLVVQRSCGEEQGQVLAVNRKSSLSVKTKVKKVLEVVNAEMSAAEIRDETLWEPQKPDITGKQTIDKRKNTVQYHEKVMGRFKAFLYLVGDRCIGFCLAEKITNAFCVVNEHTGFKNDDDFIPSLKGSSISVSRTASVALLGIARIWTCKSHRKRGVAVELLNVARNNFFYGVQVPKNLIAFSQPTESGGRLAERWFEANTGWHVYQGDI